MGALLLVMAYGIGVFALINGVSGILAKKMFSFRLKDGGPIVDAGEYGLLWGAIYMIVGALLIIFGTRLVALVV